MTASKRLDAFGRDDKIHDPSTLAVAKSRRTYLVVVTMTRAIGEEAAWATSIRPQVQGVLSAKATAAIRPIRSRSSHALQTSWIVGSPHRLHARRDAGGNSRWRRGLIWS